MFKDDDFFSPEQIDERLIVFPAQTENAPAASNPSTLLLTDLANAYQSEHQANRRSIEQVWQRLEKVHASQQTLTTVPAPPLRLVRSRKRYGLLPGRSGERFAAQNWFALVASLCIVLLVGGAVIALRHSLPSLGAIGMPTATPLVNTPLPGYPPAGKSLATSQASPVAISALSWSPDGQHLGVATRNQAWLWNLETRQYTLLDSATTLTTGLHTLSWSPDGHYLAVGTNPVELYDMTGNNVQPVTLPVHQFWPAPGSDYQAIITALSWSPDSQYLALAALRSNNGCVIQIWALQAQKLVSSVECEPTPSGVTALSWSLEGQDTYLASADGQMVQVWQALSIEPQTVFAQSITGQTSISWLPGSDSQLAFVNQKTAQIWDVGKHQPLAHPIPDLNGVLTISPDGQYLATASGKQVALWNIQTGACFYIYTGDLRPVLALAWSPDGKSLASGESGGTQNVARVWSA